MIKKNLKFVVLLILMIFPVEISALTGNIVINCDDMEIQSGETATCVVAGKNFNDEISSFHGELSLDDGLTLTNVSKDPGWEGETTDGIIDLYTASNKSGSINLFTFVVKADSVDSKKTVNVKVTDIRIGDSDFKETEFDDSTININITGKNSNDEDTPDNDNSDNNFSNNNNDNLGNGSDENNNDNNDNNNMNKDDSNIDNPQTGNYWFVIIGILIISLIGTLFYSKKSRCF